jgi:hypothetical protein
MLGTWQELPANFAIVALYNAESRYRRGLATIVM